MYTLKEALWLLEKEAAATKKKKKREPTEGVRDRAKAVAGGAALGGAGMLAGSLLPAIPVLMEDSENRVKHPLPGAWGERQKLKGESRKVLEHMRKEHNLGDVHVRKGGELENFYTHRKPAFGTSEKKFEDELRMSKTKRGQVYVSSDNPGVIAHELGHAAGDAGNHKIRSPYNLPSRMSVPVALGMMADERTRDYAPLAYGALEAPKLFEEGRASYYGLKAMHAVGGGKSLRAGLKLMLPAYGAYLGSTAGAMGGLHLVNKKLKANKEEKTKKGMTKKSGVLADAGKGLVNLAIGGRTVAAKPGKFLRRGTPEQWQPFHGIQQLGSVKQTHTEGPLKGMIKYDKDGEPLYEKSKDLFKYLGQEFRGPKPTRADMMAHARARSMPIDDAAFEAHLKQNKLPYKKSLFGKLTAAPGIERPTVGFMGADSREAARFARTAKGADRQALEEVNNLGHMEFMKKHPGLAAEWYGRNALHKGFFVGLPAYEAYNIGIKKEPIHEGEGMGSNMASSVGAGLGMAAGAPLGLFGAPLLSMATQAGGRAMGKQVDQSMGNRPMQAPAPEMTPVPRTVPR